MIGGPLTLPEEPAEEPGACRRCEEPRFFDDLDEDGVCAGCLEGDEERRQNEADYRSSVL